MLGKRPTPAQPLAADNPSRLAAFIPSSPLDAAAYRVCIGGLSR